MTSKSTWFFWDKFIFLFFCLFIYLFKRQNDKERQRDSESGIFTHQFTTQMSTPASPGLGQSHELRILAKSPMEVARAHGLRASSVAFPRVLPESWKRSRLASLQHGSGAHIPCRGARVWCPSLAPDSAASQCRLSEATDDGSIDWVLVTHAGGLDWVSNSQLCLIRHLGSEQTGEYLSLSHSICLSSLSIILKRNKKWENFLEWFMYWEMKHYRIGVIVPF